MGRLRKLLLRLRVWSTRNGRLQKPPSVGGVENSAFNRRLDASEERKRAAMNYIVRQHYDARRRREEFQMRLASYGMFQAFLYKRGRSLSLRFRVLREVVYELVIKPLGLTLIVLSGLFSFYLATQTAPRIHAVIDRLLPFPYNKIVGAITVPIGWLPVLVVGVYVSYKTERETRTRLKEEHGWEG
jgi:hypothetical protein